MDSASLIAAILASPADDLPRLVYADYLDETCDPLNVLRAELIRVQCEMMNIPVLGVTDQEIWDRVIINPNLIRMNRRLEGVFESLAKEDLGSIFGIGEHTRTSDDLSISLTLTTTEGTGAILLRGFIFEIRCTWQWWLDHHAGLYWRPEFTDACQACKGTGYDRSSTAGGTIEGPCGACGGYYEPTYGGFTRGKGRVPRPIPLTAQPLERVRITDAARDNSLDIFDNAQTGPNTDQLWLFPHAVLADNRRRWIASMLHTEWPGLDIQLSSGPIVDLPNASRR